MRIWLILLIVLAGSCHKTPTQTLTPPQPPRLGCLPSPPPISLPFRFVVAGDDGCPLHFAACIRRNSLKNLRDTLEDMAVWEDTAWLRCGDPTIGELERGAQPRTPATGLPEPPPDAAPAPVPGVDGGP